MNALLIISSNIRSLGLHFETQHLLPLIHYFYVSKYMHNFVLSSPIDCEHFSDLSVDCHGENFVSRLVLKSDSFGRSLEAIWNTWQNPWFDNLKIKQIYTCESNREKTDHIEERHFAVQKITKNISMHARESKYNEKNRSNVIAYLNQF